jgi:phospholipid/cholesterol/gamma-HCH transport system substrate-binding protein
MTFKRIRAPLMVGLVAVVAVGVFVALFGTVQKSVVGKGDGYRVHADFDDVSGLASYSRVTVSGIPVGTMESIELVTLPGGTTKARVLIRLRGDIVLYSGTPAPDGRMVHAATITRRAATMLGDYYLEITPGAAGATLGDGDAIPNVVGEAGLMAIANRLEKSGDTFAKLGQVVDNIEVVTRSMASTMGGPAGTARIDRVLEDVAKSADAIAKAAVDVRTFVERQTTGDQGGRLDRIAMNVEHLTRDAARISAASAESLEASIKNIEVITRELRDAMTGPGSDSRVTRIDESLTRLNASLANLQDATQSVANIAKKIDGGQGTLGALVNDDAIVRKVEGVVDDVGGLVQSVSRLRTQIGFRSEFNIYQRALKNYLTLRLQPDPNKYYLIELVFDPRGKTTRTNRLTLTNDPSLPGAVTEQITETKADQLKFTLEYARRFAFWTGRFGLIESTGGVGMDFEFFKDSLKFSADAFDFSGDKYPRIKGTVLYTLFNVFYVAAGIDDAMNYRGRDYFVGAGVRFTDTDLKGLLFTVGVPKL